MVEDLHRTSHSSILHHEGGLEEFHRLAHEVYVRKTAHDTCVESASSRERIFTCRSIHHFPVRKGEEEDQVHHI